MNIKHPARLAAASVLLIASLAGCVESDREASGDAETDCPWTPDDSIDTTARIAYQKIPNGDLVVKDRQILENCMPNASVEWTSFASGGDVVQAFGSNSVDIGLMGSSPTTIALSDPLNMEVSVVWIHDVIGAAESLVVRDESWEALEDLEGARVGVPFSSTAHFSLLQALQDAGMDPNNDVRLVNLQPERMEAPWQRGEIDAAWVWNPVLGQLTTAGKIILTSADTAEAGKPTYDLGAATNAFIEENPEFMRQWAMAQDHAVQLIEDDTDTAAESIAIELDVSLQEAKELMEGYTYLRAAEQADAQHLGGKLGKDLHTTAQFLLAQGEIGAVAAEQTYAAGVAPQPAEEAQ